MIPRVLCRSCSSELRPGQKICPSCKSAVDWDAFTTSNPDNATDIAGSPAVPRGAVRCPLCGHEQQGEREFCESCGNRLSASSSGKPKRSRSSPPPARKGRKSQAYVIAAVVVVAAATVVSWMMFRGAPAPVETHEMSLSHDHPPTNETMSTEIRSLELTLEREPDNVQALIQLANMLHDSRSFARAIPLYERYLSKDPTNPDARVDLGICLFEMSLVDTTHGMEFGKRAVSEMERAVKDSPRHQLAHFNLGVVNLQMGNLETAHDWFSRCIAIDPKTQVAQKAQQLVTQHTFQ